MILNLTQHAATVEQVNVGVVEPEDKKFVGCLLTFNEIPSAQLIADRAEMLAQYAACHGVSKAMVGGAPYLMGALETALKEHGITPLYAFSVRESVEEAQADGSVRKVNVFKHIGFVGE